MTRLLSSLRSVVVYFIVCLTREISWLMVMMVNVRTAQLCSGSVENQYSKRPIELLHNSCV